MKRLKNLSIIETKIEFILEDNGAIFNEFKTFILIFWLTRFFYQTCIYKQ